MKLAIAMLATAGLLCGCTRKPAALPPPVAAPVAFEYSVQLFEMPSSIQAVAQSKIDLEVAQHDLAQAKFEQMLVMHEITGDQAKDSNIEAQANLKVNSELLQWHADYDKAQAVADEISSQTTNGWELVSMVPTQSPNNYFLILKRQKP
jgi:hypothetical protein